MARRENELFIGSNQLTIEGRVIKHPALIKYYATANVNKIKNKKPEIYAIDIETNHLTGELKLFGVWDGVREKYSYYTHDFLNYMFMWVKNVVNKRGVLAHWNRLDPFIMFKQFLLALPSEQQQRGLEKYGKISGEWDRKTHEWTVEPVARVTIGDIEFGIKNVIRSSIQFYIKKPWDDDIKTVWAFDIAQMLPGGLESEANKRFDWYSKVDKSAHLVDWDRFEKDKDYRENIVLKSNMLDAKACHALAHTVLDDFKRAFGWYPASLVSSGSLARSALVADVWKRLEHEHSNKEQLKEAVFEEISSIGIMKFYDEWAENHGAEFMKDLYALLTEAYSGGYIEAVYYGYSPEAWYADLASAYPAEIQYLYDLRNASWDYGEGEPPHAEKGYVFIRGEVTIPEGVNYHPVTVKHPIFKDTNIRPTGEFRASYTIEERDFLLEQGATFKNEAWYRIETEGKLSPLAKSCTNFVKLRQHLRKQGDSAQQRAKDSANSLYGILYEAISIHKQLTHDEVVLDAQGDGYYKSLGLGTDDVVRTGYRAGEFWNPLYASVITSRVRLKLARASVEIEKKGGKPVILMTDSITWQGTADMLPKDMVKTPKTLGYFEPPEKVKDLVCLGSGRYGYKDETGEKYEAKKRGLNAVDIHDPNGVPLGDFNWEKVLNVMKQTNETEIDIKVRTLVSPGLVYHSLENYQVEDLGRIIEDKRNVKAVVGKTKRAINREIENPQKLASQLVKTDPIHLVTGMFGKYEVMDQTLPQLREQMMKRKLMTRQERKRDTSNRTSKRYYKKHHATIRKNYKERYAYIRGFGYDWVTSQRMANWSDGRVEEKLREDDVL